MMAVVKAEPRILAPPQTSFFLKTRINKQDKQKITFPGSAYPKEISQQYTPATHTEAVHSQRVLLGVFHPYL